MTDIEREDNGAEPVGSPADQIADLLKDSVEMVADYRCKHHPARPATSICEACNSDVCSNCSHVRNNRLICSKCMSGLDKAFAGTGVASPFARWLTHPFVIALVIAGLVGIAFFRLTDTQREGLLGRRPANVGEAEKQFQLKILLFARKASRIETHADSLYEMARYEKADEEFQESKTVYEYTIDETEGRWEQPLLMLARARLLEKLGQEDYAEGLYKNVATIHDPEKTHSVIARIHLGKLQEKHDPEEALKTYRRLLSDINVIPANKRAAINITVKADKPYNYETRLHRFAGADVDFDDIEAEANLRMGLVLVGLGRGGEAERRFHMAARKTTDAEIEKWAYSEARKLFSIRLEKERAEGLLFEYEKEPEEEVVITHF
jgi:tetratricopeptide (TPR) repeat protein